MSKDNHSFQEERLFPEALVQATPIDAAFVKAALPPRYADSHKGTYGRLSIYAGSQKYRGAALLAAEGALRMGVGYVTLFSENAVVTSAVARLPEVLFEEISPIAGWEACEIPSRVLELQKASALLVGPGLGVSQALFDFLCALVRTEGAPLVLDADALNAIAEYAESVEGFFKAARRKLLLTPHPLELARLLGVSTREVQADREAVALAAACRFGVYLLLKGSGTLTTDGERLFINTSGSSALSKGGSGDVLAGAVGALLAEGASPLDALSIAAYLHGAAGDSLAREVSEYGVLPSELPRRMARLIAEIRHEFSSSYVFSK